VSPNPNHHRRIASEENVSEDRDSAVNPSKDNLSNAECQPAFDALRYRRQTQFAAFGKEGQARLAASKVLIVGVGALGSTIAERLVRAGVGAVRLVDRDWVELDNLPRQTLYTEADVHHRTPKAIAAAAHLRAINSQCSLTADVCDVTFETVSALCTDIDIVLDGTDNFETRFLINDVAHQRNLPWVHGGVLGGAGQVMAIVPGQTACFRCLVPDLPPAGSFETCDSAGVMGPAVSIIGSWQAMLAIQRLSDPQNPPASQMTAIDIWNGQLRSISAPRETLAAHCPACNGQYDFLSGQRHQSATVLCGKDAVQLQPSQPGEQLDLNKIGERLSHIGQVESNPFLIRVNAPPHTLTLFRDGRTIISGTEDPAEARKLYTQWLGG
jgi:adenylyltransferase/sulfurtransferase